MTKLLKTAALLAALSAAHAEETEFSKKVWVSPGFISYHFDRNADLNETNQGIGLEYTISPSQSIVAGSFKNSERSQSTYIGSSYQPWHFGNFKFGAVVGVINGYSGTVGGFTPMVAPVISYEHSKMGANVLLIPNIPINNAKIHGAVAFQFKFAFE